MGKAELSTEDRGRQQGKPLRKTRNGVLVILSLAILVSLKPEPVPAGQLEPAPILGAVVGIPLALPLLLSCGDRSRRRSIKPIPLRTFSAFALDPVIKERYWLEAGGRVGRFEEKDQTLDFQIYSASVFCGFRSIEAGVSTPYLREQFESPVDDSSLAGVGDTHIFGKKIFELGESAGYALGYRVSFPSGREEKDLGTGELAFMPFFSFRVGVLGTEFRSYAGYELVNEASESIPDSFLYGGSLLFRLGPHIAVRGEVNGTRFNQRNFLRGEPGLDIRIPVGNQDMVFRFNYAMGMTDETEDYEFGGALVFSQR